MGSESRQILAVASQGTDSGDEARLRVLLRNFKTEFLPFSRTNKKEGFWRCFRRLREGGFDLFVFEGTGFAIGLAAILARLLFKRRYVFSSGDAVAPFLSARLPLARPFFETYERMLYRFCSGFIAWTPYLAGRAITFGASKAVTAPGWAPNPIDRDAMRIARAELRRELGVPQDAVMFGLVGSLTWSNRYRYCYGIELVRAAKLAKSVPWILVVGEGSGLTHLKALAGDALGKTTFIPGRVDRKDVPRYLAAMDIGSLPQTTDDVGSFRYTTKISEYRDAELCFVTSEIPMAYDLDQGDIWRLPGLTPWSNEYLNALAELMDTVTSEQIRARKTLPKTTQDFDQATQVHRVTAFISDILR